MSHQPFAATAATDTSEAFATAQDARDPLAPLRSEFLFPHSPAGRTLYFVGNSLGLQPRSVRSALEQELDDWARLGVEGHFAAKHPWMPYHEEVREPLARLVGALPHEVVAMNSLTTNLHLLMVSFYRPTRERYKIVIEDTAFPSDSYAVQSQLAFHARHIGFDPNAGIIRLKPRDGESTLRTDDILAAIDRERDSIALLMLGGVNYLTGQLFDIASITHFAQARGIVAGWDLAHAAGNAHLHLHDWNCDFAAWCSYKYLNSGPGAVAGAFVHERHTQDAKSNAALPRFAGWWGNDPKSRFTMGPDFTPVQSVDAWQLSNPPVLALAPLRESLKLFDRATMAGLRAKSLALTAYLEAMLRASPAGSRVRVLTPRDPIQRGAQLSLAIHGATRDVVKSMLAKGVYCDFREPNVIRVAPAPLYNSFSDVWHLVRVMNETLP